MNEIYKMKSAFIILGILKGQVEGLTWYSLVRMAESKGAEPNPPPYAVIKRLLEDEYLDVEQPLSNTSKYRITSAGLDLLNDMDMQNSD